MVHRLTQEELLEEAKLTEISNRESLASLLKLEEEMKAVTHAKVELKGPRIVYHSKGGVNTYTFSDKQIPSCINSKKPGKQRLLCLLWQTPACPPTPCSNKANSSSC